VARDFNGNTDRIDYASPFDTTGQPITISVWLNKGSTTGASEYIFNSASSGGGPGLLLYLPTGLGNAVQFFRNGSGSQLDKTTTNTLSTDLWYNLIATHDGVMTTHSSVHIYIDGAEASYASGTNGSSEITSNSGFEVGGRSVDDIRNLRGRVGELAVWNGVQTPGVIAALADRYAPSFFTDDLKFYSSLVNHPDALYSTGASRTGTLDGTTVFAGHPPIIYPSRVVRLKSAVAPVAKLHVITTGMQW